MLFVWSPLMINTRNLGSKGSVRVKCKDCICAELCLKLWFESDWYFRNIIESGRFKSNCPKTKFQTNTFLSQFRSSRTQMVLKIGLLKHFTTVKHLFWSLFLIKLKKRLHYRCIHVNIANFFNNSFLYRTPPVAAFVSLIE